MFLLIWELKEVECSTNLGTFQKHFKNIKCFHYLDRSIPLGWRADGAMYWLRNIDPAANKHSETVPLPDRSSID